MLIVNAELREEKGKSISRRLRVKNKFPGILYGANQESTLLILDHNSIFNLQKKIEFYKEYLLLIIQDQKYTVKVQAVQRHSFKLKLLHIDFLHV
ncbi:50S ribosomal protein L25 [Buchnera aphidicola (Brachycaudus cardui)]|uniref:Large ribosomal subunit protein bL25 n=1 Tax=Buchnera aphidicola (Brachycaudus cardui) TaxID=557993 RepID=A0A4D6Y391_9GAMM|nr:50S ribosomal protein L25 [Buchnera aphidicola]QCI20291.1 50S ribosomal protein L25 [Buchnera aphidicola (Brachycaudus cardui)]